MPKNLLLGILCEILGTQIAEQLFVHDCTVKETHVTIVARTDRTNAYLQSSMHTNSQLSCQKGRVGDDSAAPRDEHRAQGGDRLPLNVH